MKTIPRPPRAVMLIAAVLITGCSTDNRYIELSRESMQRQAEQNADIAHQSQTVADAARELVQADARARTEMIAAQKELETSLQAERGQLNEARDKLEQDRQVVVAMRQWEPVVANAIWSSALLLAVLLPLVLGIYLVRNLGSTDAGQDLAELLTLELTATESPLLPRSTPRLLNPTPGPAAVELTASEADHQQTGAPHVPRCSDQDRG